MDIQELIQKHFTSFAPQEEGLDGDYLDLIPSIIKLDGDILTDEECLFLIGELIDLWKEHKETIKQGFCFDCGNPWHLCICKPDTIEEEK